MGVYMYMYLCVCIYVFSYSRHANSAQRCISLRHFSVQGGRTGAGTSHISI